MNIMFLAQWYAPEEVSTAIYTTELAIDLAKRGHQVTMVTGAPNYPYGRVFDGYKNQLYKVEQRDGVRVVRIWSYVGPKTFWKRILNYGTYSFSSFYGGLLAGKPDIVISYTPPLPLGISAWALSRLWNVPWVLYIEDLYPDAAVSAGYLKNQAVINFFYRMEKFIYRRVTRVAVLSEMFCRNLTRKGVPQEKISQIPLWADTAAVHPMPKENGFRKQYGLEGKFVLMYAGNLGVTSCLEDVLCAAELLNDDPDIRFVLIGEGCRKEEYEAIARQKGLKNTQFLPFQPRQAFCEMLAAADMDIVTLNACSSESSLPSKTFNYLSSRRPILAVAPMESDLALLIEEGACGVTIPNQHPEEVVETILRLKSHPEQLDAMGENGRKHLVAKYERSQCVTLFDNMLASTLSMSPNGKAHKVLSPSLGKTNGKSKPATGQAEVFAHGQAAYAKKSPAAATPAVLNRQRLGDFAKRAFDITVSLFMLIILSPLFALIAQAIKHDSPGPVFYRGPRVGFGGKKFSILKFRTMYENAESYAGPKITAHDDHRITPLGRWLRSTKLNELPQFWNVLIGEMSLVGPRPEDPELAAKWSKAYRDEVLSVRPGITSPASVQYHNEENLLESGSVMENYIHKIGPEKMRLDRLYVHYRSFWLDLDTMLWTALVMLPQVGMETIPEQMLFVGPVTQFIRRYLNWFVLDTIITFFAIAATGVIWRMFRPLYAGLLFDIIGTVGFSLLFGIIGALTGVNRISWSKATFSDVFDLSASWMGATLIAFVANRYLKIFPSEMLLLSLGTALAGYIVARYRSRLITGLLSRILEPLEMEEKARERVLIIGAGSSAQHTAWLLSHPTNTNKYRIVGFVDDNLAQQGMRIYGARLLGTLKEIPHLVEKHHVSRIFLADQDIFSSQYPQIAKICAAARVKLMIIPDMLTTLSRMVEVNPNPQQVLSIPSTGRQETEPSNGSPCAHCCYKQAMNVQPDEERIERIEPV